MRIGAIAAIVLAVASFSVPARANPVDVDFTVSGSSGNWTLDFSVQNNMNPSGMALYFFGVQLPTKSIVASPVGYGEYGGDYWDTSWTIGIPGSGMIYNNNWIDNSWNHLFPGESLDGFLVHLTEDSAPTSVNWFAYGWDGSIEYVGTGYFNTAANPGFEGIATQAAVAEPSNLGLVSIALTGLIAMRRSKRKD
jgi:hypothetical protein